jgi:hypothetical protein
MELDETANQEMKMFKKKAPVLQEEVLKGEALIAKGMSALTHAVGLIEQGTIDNQEEIKLNQEEVAVLNARNAELTSANEKSLQVVANFKKNILGE